MKIIRVDNYGREDVSDRLVADNIKIEYEAFVMQKALNDAAGEYGDSYYKVAPDNHALYKFEP